MRGPCFTICFLMLVNITIQAQSYLPNDQADPAIALYPEAHSSKNELPSFAKQQNFLFSSSLLLTSTMIWDFKHDIRSIRQLYWSDFRHHFDDYLQYTPGVAIYALNWSGIPAKNNTPAMLTHHLTSLATMGFLVNSIKNSVAVLRPDGSSYNSFPSGHTAMAFANAAMLQKEYGHISIWYPIIGYTAATCTGLGRMLNNRHWLPDILAGAGIGVLSTHFAYFVVDRIKEDYGSLKVLSRETTNSISLQSGYVLSSHAKGLALGLTIGSIANTWGMYLDGNYLLPTAGHLQANQVHSKLYTFTLGTEYHTDFYDSMRFSAKMGIGQYFGQHISMIGRIKQPLQTIAKGGVHAGYSLNKNLFCTAYTEYNLLFRYKQPQIKPTQAQHMFIVGAKIGVNL